MNGAEIAVAIGVTTAGGLVAGGFGGLAWVGRRIISKFDAMDKAVRGNGADAPGLGEQIRSVHTDVLHVRREFKEHVDGEPVRIEAAIIRRLEGEE